MHEPDDLSFPLAAYLRAARRAADLSQRELASRAGVSAGTVGTAESDEQTSDPRLSTMLRLLCATGHRLVVVDGDGTPLTPLAGGGPRDRALRRYPAHLDARTVRDLYDWWYGPFLTTLEPLPPFTFDLCRHRRDERRRRSGRRGQGSDRSRP